MKKGRKIHFVHHLEKRYAPANLGDWICSPYHYFTDYFDQYTSVLHSDWAVLWHEIERNDVVIFGGGGLLDNSDELNHVLNRLIHVCDNVILWAPGTHKYNENNVFGKKTAALKINYEGAALIGVRDFEHPSGLPYLPCVSCMNPAFDAPEVPVATRRRIGTVKSALEKDFAVSGVPSSVTNAEPIGTVVDYIRSSETILVSSYHGAYWAMLLGRKALLPSSRLGVDKYRFFRHPVGFYPEAEYDEAKLLALAETLPDLPDFLAESKRLNLEFFERCKLFIEQKVEPASPNDTLHIMAKRNAQLEFTIIDMWDEIKKLNSRITIMERGRGES